MPSEADPLKKYYFINNNNSNYSGGTTAAVRDLDGGLQYEEPPTSDPTEFAPRPKNDRTMSSPVINAKTSLKPRKAPIKIEPKVFFANERTFLAWMHVSVILAGGSIAILAFAEDVSSWYGMLLLPTAIAFIVYSMYQYQRRARMIRLRMPGPYEDTVGPTVLGIMLMGSITAQFALKLYELA